MKGPQGDSIRRVEVVDDDPKNYAFSNVFDVAPRLRARLRRQEF